VEHTLTFRTPWPGNAFETSKTQRGQCLCMPNTGGQRQSMRTYGLMHYAWLTKCTCTPQRGTDRHHWICSHKLHLPQLQNTFIPLVVQSMFLPSLMGKDQSGRRDQGSGSTLGICLLMLAVSLLSSTLRQGWLHHSFTLNLTTCLRQFQHNSFKSDDNNAPDSQSQTNWLPQSHQSQICTYCRSKRRSKI
jgi:hypothetical protein